PTRRSPTPYPASGGVGFQANNADPFDVGARTDYAANGGVTEIWPDFFHPLAEIEAAQFPWPKPADCTGVACSGVIVRLAQISDGTSNTYMVGEKYLNSDKYKTGDDPADNETIYGGYDWDYIRWTGRNMVLQPEHVPRQDTPGFNTNYAYGSAHPASWNVVMCDGSVHSLSYSIDTETHRRLGWRGDGLPVNIHE
ncbi:MAG: DUF1559 domain-containing protein, partial [Planctomycetales bacterium]|nr:DUF1559 domain-containing protein [Planctomycetales bacterium]